MSLASFAASELQRIELQEIFEFEEGRFRRCELSI